ncbi:aldo/keto reductase family domain-containing protein [Ditylenchus destructor]|nr:aldo/keto reductase family domain-containing protein [Ditylenchus destructor]
MVQTGAIKLSNGVNLPLFGLGTFLASDASQLKTALRAALDCGYRYIDTAYRYKNEAVIGEVLQEYYDAGKLKREDIFLTTKLPFYGHGNPEDFLQNSLKTLQTDYIDLFLMHTPLPSKLNAEGTDFLQGPDGKPVPELIPLIDTWRFMEKHYKAGTLKAIGISNFNAKQIQELYDQAEIKPHNLQVELHILHPQHDLVKLCQKLNISVTSYGTLGSPGSAQMRQVRSSPHGDCMGHPVITEIAQKHHKTPAQILLRHMIQRGVSVIPKSTNPDRVRQNIDIFDFQISDEDFKRIEEIRERQQLFDFEFLRHHPWYPL